MITNRDASSKKKLKRKAQSKMNDHTSKVEELLSRLNGLESVLMHIQHDIEQLNEAILQQGRVVDAITKSMKQLDFRIGMLEEEEEGPDSYQEKPPHY